MVGNYGDDPGLAQLVWLVKNLAALRETGGHCHVLHYEAILKDPAAAARGLSEFLHGEARVASLDEAALLPIVRAELNRSVTFGQKVENPLVRRLYGALLECSGHSFDREALASEVRDIHAVVESFLPWPHEAGRIVASLRTRAKSLGGVATTVDVKEESIEPSSEIFLPADDWSSDDGLGADLSPTKKWASDLTLANAQLAKELSETRSLLEQYQNSRGAGLGLPTSDKARAQPNAEGEFGSFSNALDASRKECDELKARLDRLKSSVSWRSTAWLRSIGRLVRRYRATSQSNTLSGKRQVS
jgi:hypothetical protein